MADMKGSRGDVGHIDRTRDKPFVEIGRIRAANGPAGIDGDRDLEEQGRLEMQEVLHEFETVRLEDDIRLDRPAQERRVQKLAHAALGRRQDNTFAGKIADADCVPAYQPVACRHDAMDLLAQRCRDMDMGRADRGKDQRDVCIQREQPRFCLLAVAAGQVEAHRRVRAAIAGDSFGKEAAQRVGAAGNPDMSAPDARQVGDLRLDAGKVRELRTEMLQENLACRVQPGAGRFPPRSEGCCGLALSR